jgi:transposase InsO family protein
MTIKLGDNNTVQAKKKGRVRLKGIDIEAFFVPDFPISLLSVSQLDLSGFTATFRSGVCSIINTHGKGVLEACLERGLYTLTTESGSAHTSKLRQPRRTDSIDIWHQRFGHLNYVDLRRILESEKTRIPWKTPALKCETCIQSKQQQRVAHTKASRTSTPFELVHSDLCGPMKHSIGGAQYYIVYIDDCTRYTEVYFLVTKSAEEISTKFRHYQAWVEARGFRIKRFRCDNGTGEYNNSVFLSILGEKGITYEPSPPYTQHKNGVSERMIRTLNTKARSMMREANVPIQFWPEAVRTACYLHRRSPTSSLSGNRSPYEAVFGTAPRIGHLRRFGCRVYKHIPPAQRTEKKFGSRSSACMMLGYVHNTTKIWRIWDFSSGTSRNGRAVECSSVSFQEEDDAYGSPTGERSEIVEFPEAEETEEEIREEMNDQEMNDPPLQDCSVDSCDRPL